MTKNRSTSRLVLGAVVAALAGVASRAEAACDANGNPTGGGPCYRLKGSDTLFDIMTKAINDARTLSVPGASDLFYEGSGSGNAETQMRTATATGIGVQSIGPMSRNFRPSVIDPLSPDFTKRCLNSTDPGCTAAAPTASGHAAWAPTAANVVGLDAAVFVVKNTVLLDNLDFVTFVDNAVPTAFRKAVRNNSALQTDFGNGAAFNNLASNVNYSNIMSIVLAGYDGSGTIAACADPRRVQAIQDLAGLLGVTTIDHLYRRDDNSGTTDTFKDRIMVVANSGTIAARYPWTGGRFCNGTAVGGISGAVAQQGICSATRTTFCTVDANCPAGEKCWFNLNNQDFDPIRRPCTPADATRAPTSCSDLTTGRTCKATDGNPNCTQGLIVALTDTDPGSPDITVSIGNRVKISNGEVIGYAGREAASAALSTKSLGINTIRAFDDRVRDSTYLLARRLFIQNTAANSTDANDIPTLNQTANGITGGSVDQRTKEQSLWNSFLTNRSLMDPIVRQFNFIRCAAANDGDDPCNETNNLCCIIPAAPTPGAFGAYNPSGALGGSSGTGGAKSITSVGRVWNGTAIVQDACTGTNLCVSGKACSALLCPDADPRPLNAACSVDGDCSSGRCRDVFGHGAPGAAYGKYCCDPANPSCI
jgi:hypothetical protein